MNILFHTNCQGEGLIHFLRYSEDYDKVSTRVNLVYMIALNLVSQEEVQANIEWANVILYHEVKGYPTPLKHNVPSIPLSVFHNEGYYLSFTKDNYWKAAYELARLEGVRCAANAVVTCVNMGYTELYNSNVDRMIEKEVCEGVPEDIRLSNIILNKYQKEQQALVANHPTSYVYFDWVNAILHKLNLRKIDQNLREQCCVDLNAARMPCVDWICSGAKNALGLNYGGTEVDDSECFKFAYNKIQEAIK
jgi:hypothetical protein